MAHHAIRPMVLAVGGLALMGQAYAQSTVVPNRASQYQKQQQVSPDNSPAAPARRRQPRPADVPVDAGTRTETSPDPALSDDEALNRQISGICRGC